MTPEQLKISVLKAVVQGKITEQRSAEGTVRDMYGDIPFIDRADLSEDLYDIPESWGFVYLEDIVDKEIRRGKSPKYDENGTAYAFAQKCNSKYSGIQLGLALKISDESLSRYAEDDALQNNDIVINSTGTGTLGRIGFYNDDCNVNKAAYYPDSHVTLVRVRKDIVPRYIYYCLLYNHNFLESMGEGSTNQKELKPATIKKVIIPLPPYAEQRRIVAKVDEIALYIDRYAKTYKKLEIFNAKFPDDMKKSILQYAIQGKLVEQRPEEGTAEELYKQIQEEKQKLIKEGKIKKEKPLADITDEEIPFDIPESWKWCRIGSIFTLQAGKNISASKIFSDKSEQNNYVCYGGNGVRGYVDAFNRSGSYAIIGRQGALCGCINFACGEFYATEHAVTVEHYNLTDTTWSGLFLRALNLNQYATATAQPGLAVSNINQVLIPLPPLEEQKRIVAKIEELMPYCEKLRKEE